MSGNQWLEELHRANYDMLVRLARYLLRNSAASEDDAEDVVQQAFMLAAQKRISEHEAPTRWLIRTVRNLCMNCATKAARTAQKTQRIAREKMDSSVRSAYMADMQQDPTEEKEMRILLEQMLDPGEMQLLQQYCLKDVPAGEMAGDRNLSSAALRVRVCRIRKKLRKAYFGEE